MAVDAYGGDIRVVRPSRRPSRGSLEGFYTVDFPITDRAVPRGSEKWVVIQKHGNFKFIKLRVERDEGETLTQGTQLSSTDINGPYWCYRLYIIPP